MSVEPRKFIKAVVPKNLNLKPNLNLPITDSNIKSAFVPKRKIDRVNDPNNDLMFLPVEESVVDQNTEELPPGLGWTHISDAGVTAHSTTGALSKTEPVPSGVYREAEEQQKKQKMEYFSNENKVIVNYIDDDKKSGRVYRQEHEDDCYIDFSLEGKTLTINHFICPDGGKELLRDTIQELQKKNFTNIMLTAANLDPNRFNPSQFVPKLFNQNDETINNMISAKYIVKDKLGNFSFTPKYSSMQQYIEKYIDKENKVKYRFTQQYHDHMQEKIEKNYTDMGFQKFSGIVEGIGIGTEIFKGTREHILDTLKNFVRPTKAGSKTKTKKRRRQKKTKRRTNRRRQTKKYKR